MKYPPIDELKLDGMIYSVYMHEATALGIDAYGRIDFANLRIDVVEQEPAVMLQTMWHEKIHHINHYRLGDALTEEQIDAIATGINAGLLDNPDFAEQIVCVANKGEFLPELED
jgi:hypothetical protein